MEKDAVSAGVSEVGGLFSTAEVRILICDLLSSINKPVPVSMLGDMLHYEGIANVFEVNDSIAALCEKGHLKVFDANDGLDGSKKDGKISNKEKKLFIEKVSVGSVDFDGKTCYTIPKW